MFRIFRIDIHQRGVLLRDELPVRALPPGRHVVWAFGADVIRYDVRALLLDAPAEVLAVLPADWFAEAVIGPRERGVLFEDGVPAAFLRPGTRRWWTVGRDVRLEVFDVGAPVPELTDELLATIPAGELVREVVHEHERGLAYVQGRFERVLEPGRHVFWTHPELAVEIRRVDVRRQTVAVVGQELMTRDKVTLRLNLAATFSIVDPAKAAHSVGDVHGAVYLSVQLAARRFVAGVTLDELLEGRDAMSAYLAEIGRPELAEIGVALGHVGVKDVVLPGEMKTLLNRVIEAEKEAAANVILRREETAATRSLANTAKVMADNPVLLRLRELDAMKEIAERIQEVRVVVGAEGLATVLPARLLSGDER